MKKNKFITLFAAIFIALNFILLLTQAAPPVEIICDRPQEGEGRCFEQVPGDCDCRWTGYTDDSCQDTCGN